MRYVSRPCCFFATLTVLGVGGAFWEWVDHGTAAGVEPGFIVALTAAAVGAICWTIMAVVPLAFAAFAAGARHAGAGRPAEVGAARPRRRLTSA